MLIPVFINIKIVLQSELSIFRHHHWEQQQNRLTYDPSYSPSISENLCYETMSEDIALDYPLESEFVQILKEAQGKDDHQSVQTLLWEASQENLDIIIEFSNDDWVKDPDVELPPAVLLGKYNTKILIMNDDAFMSVQRRLKDFGVDDEIH